MSSYARFVALTLSFATLVSSRAWCDDTVALLARFRTEGPEAWARLESMDDEFRYSATWTRTETFYKEQKKTERKSTFVWVRRPDCLRVEQIELDGKNAGRTTVYVCTDSHLFEVNRAQGESGWQLVHSGAIKEKTDVSYMFLTIGMRLFRPATTFASGKQYNLRELASDPTFTPEKARVDGELVRIDYRTSGIGPLGKRPFETLGSIAFDPSNHWAVQSYEFAYADGSFRASLVNTFSPPDRDGVKRIVSTKYASFAAHGSVGDEFSYEWEKSGLAPPEQFRLASFGLPDPLGPLPRKFPTTLVLAAAAVVCGLIAIWFRRRAQLARRPFASGSGQ